MTGRLVRVMLVAWAGISAAGQAQTKPRFDLEALRALVRIEDVQLAPDGKTVAVVTARPDYDANRYQRELLLVDVATGHRRVLTQDRWAVFAPRWSPTGDRLAFLGVSTDPGAAGVQLWVLPLGGGEAQRITAAPAGVEQYAWHPNGHQLAFASEDPPVAREGEERHNQSFEVDDDNYLTREAPRPVHLWIVADTGGPARRLTQGAWSLTKADATSPMSFSPSGDRIAVASQETAHSGASFHAVIRIVDLATGEVRPIASGFAVNPLFSPDGQKVVFSHPRGQAPFFSSNGLLAVDLRSGQERWLTSRVDRNFTSGAWLPGGSLLASAPDGTGRGAWSFGPDGSARRLNWGELEPITEVSVANGGGVAFAATAPGAPAEVYYAASIDDPPKRLTDLNVPVERYALARNEGFEWSVSGGLRADGVLTYPPDFQPGRRYPLVIWMHGGPMGASSRGFVDRIQLLAANGWLVFEPNYRGSVNRGNAYQSAIIGDAGEGPGRDVMAGLMALIGRGIVDTTRMALAGWSYGGYMTVWLMGHYQRWKAAVAGAAVTDFSDSYNLSDLNIGYGYGWGGSMWSERYELLVREQSPITSYLAMRTPTLILSNTGDVRVPIVESYKLYHALKDRGVPVKFVAYPIGGHVPGDPVHMRDVYRRMMEWLRRYLE